MEIEDRLSRTTRLLDERNMRTLVAPAFAELTLKEVGVARCDYFIKQLARRSHSRARQARDVLRTIMDKAGLKKVTPHRFRRTGATAIYEAGGIDLTAGLLGHTDSRITEQHYIARDDLVDPATASMLEKRFGQ